MRHEAGDMGHGSRSHSAQDHQQKHRGTTRAIPNGRICIGKIDLENCCTQGTLIHSTILEALMRIHAFLSRQEGIALNLINDQT